jgi:NTE family protein
VTARWFASREAWGADVDRTRGDVAIAHAFKWGRMTFYPGLRGCANYSDDVTFGTSCRLGGFLRLSGLGQGELLGSYSVFGSLVSYFALKKIDLGALSQEIYAGLSLEGGNAYADADDITWGSLIPSGSIFLGARTAIGPIYLGYGLSEGGTGRIYFLLGQRF